MPDRKVTMRKPNPRMSSVLSIATIGFLGLSMAGCGEASGGKASSNEARQTSSESFEKSLEKEPCEVVTKEVVSKSLDIPADTIEKTSVSSSYCEYGWDGDGKTLSVHADIDVFASAEKAADSFRGSTRSISAKQLAAAMETITRDAKEKLGDASDEAADKFGKSVSSGGFHFEDVEGLADQARFGVESGKLYVVKGNLRLTLSAYHGRDMPMPKKLDPKAIMQASRKWQQDTLPERKRQSIELAKAVLETL